MRRRDLLAGLLATTMASALRAAGPNKAYRLAFVSSVADPSETGQYGAPLCRAATRLRRRRELRCRALFGKDRFFALRHNGLRRGQLVPPTSFSLQGLASCSSSQNAGPLHSRGRDDERSSCIWNCQRSCSTGCKHNLDQRRRSAIIRKPRADQSGLCSARRPISPIPIATRRGRRARVLCLPAPPDTRPR
jgi:hypothetical protein